MGARMMIVDDDEDITTTFKIGLEMHGFRVYIFNDPIKALLCFKKDLYDLIILDVKMPKLNGFELGRELLKIDNGAKICFITIFKIYYESLDDSYPTSNYRRLSRNL